MKFLRFSGLLTALLLTALASGCSTKHSSSSSSAGFSLPNLDSPYSNRVTYPDLTQEAMRMLARTALIDCEADACEPAVGMLTAIDGQTLVSCTSFLVSATRAVTNRHCLPKDLASAGASATDRIWIAFPHIYPRYYSERHAVAKIVALSPAKSDKILDLGPDWAVLELQDASARPPLTVSNRPFKAGADEADFRSSAIYKVDPDKSSDAPAGHLRKVSCNVRTHTLYLPESGIRSATVAFDGCGIVHGNSGSPIMASDREVWAVVQSVVTPWDDVIKGSRKVQVDPTQSLEEVAIGSTLGCIPELAPVEAAAENFRKDCEFDPNRFQDMNANLRSLAARLDSQGTILDVEFAAQAKMDPAQRQGWLDTTPFGWDAKVVAAQPLMDRLMHDKPPALFDGDARKTFITIPLPGCVHKQSLVDMLQAGKDSQALDFEMPVTGVRMGLTAQLQLGFYALALNYSVPITVELRPNLKTAADGQRTVDPAITVRLQGADPAQPALLERWISSCEPF